jgi:nicotinamide riboside transporter PnuC
VVVAAVFFVVATGFSWWRWRVREQQEARRQE